jgi:hypothetical protein
MLCVKNLLLLKTYNFLSHRRVFLFNFEHFDRNIDFRNFHECFLNFVSQSLTLILTF